MANECEVCGRSVFEVPLHRYNPVGETPARWRCKEHVGREVDETLLWIFYEDKDISDCQPAI